MKNSIPKTHRLTTYAFFSESLSGSQYELEVVPRGDGNQRDSDLRIVAQCKKQLLMDDNVAFVKEEYRTGGKGFYIDKKEVAV